MVPRVAGRVEEIDAPGCRGRQRQERRDADSVLGRKKDRVIGTLISNIPSTFEVAEGDVRLCGVLVDIDPQTGRSVAIERLMVSDRSG